MRRGRIRWVVLGAVALGCGDPKPDKRERPEVTDTGGGVACAPTAVEGAWERDFGTPICRAVAEEEDVACRALDSVHSSERGCHTFADALATFEEALLEPYSARTAERCITPDGSVGGYAMYMHPFGGPEPGDWNAQAYFTFAADGVVKGWHLYGVPEELRCCSGRLAYEVWWGDSTLDVDGCEWESVL